MLCKWCLESVFDPRGYHREHAPQWCPARSLLPGERFPHEAETAGDRMVRDLARRANRASLFGRGRKRR